MLYLQNILKKYINISDDAQNIANNLTLKTCEIEGIYQRQIPQDVVIGKVRQLTKHPQADKLFVCQVDCGNRGTYQIITGGENIKNNVYVPVALVGCFLPAVNLHIQPRQMRGMDSIGMICSKEELGINLDTDKHWIWILDEDFDDLSDDDLGKPFIQKYNWLDNVIFDVDNSALTHRPDLTGHFGIAIELNGIYYQNKDLVKYNKIEDYIKSFSHTNILQLLSASLKSNIKIQAQTSGLNSYILLELNNIKVKESDFYTKVLMTDLGHNPKSNWVDFSNIFMYLAGQPIHFFDKDQIDGQIIIRNAKDQEEFVDLFGNKHILKDYDIVIADNSKILALAGIVGANGSQVTENTKNIAVEIANFDPITIRKTATRLGLRTDAEIRFEKAINPVYSLYVLNLFLDELKYFSKTLGDYSIGGLNYYISDKLLNLLNNPKTIQIDFEDMQYFVFGEQNQTFVEQAKQILNCIGFTQTKDQTYLVPIRRSLNDINISADIYEETIRIYGYEKIPNKNIYTNMQYKQYSYDVVINRSLEDILSRLGFDQVETYPWVAEKTLDMFNIKKDFLFKVINCVDPNLSYIKDKMFYNFVEIIRKNFRDHDKINIFEVGKVWSLADKKENGKTYEYTGEKNVLCVMRYQKKATNYLDDSTIYLKNVLKIILKTLKVDYSYELQITQNGNFYPRKQADIVLNGHNIGYIASLHPVYFKFYDLPQDCEVSFFELDLDVLKSIMQNTTNQISQAEYETLADQIVYRDLSFLIDKDQNFGKIIDAVKQTKGVKDVEVFDVYQGQNIPDNKKSISLKIKIIGTGKTTNDQINSIMNEAIANVSKVGGSLRQ